MKSEKHKLTGSDWRVIGTGIFMVSILVAIIIAELVRAP